MTELAWPLNVPVLTDGLVTLRAHTPADSDRMLQMALDPDMVRWTSVPVPSTRATTEHFAFEVIPNGWNEGSARCWAIEFEGRYAGNVDIRGKDALVDIGYALHPDCRGHGVMTAAVNLAIEHAFVEAGKEAVQWRAHVGNVASLRVAHACGFRLHHAEPDMLVERGAILDAWTGSRRFGDAPTPRTRWNASTIEAGELVLRPAVEADLARWAQAEDDPVSRHWFDQTDMTVDKVRESWHRTIWACAKGERAAWTVADRATDAYLGTVSIFGIEHGSGEIGYFLHPDARGRGAMTRAVRAATDHALDPDGLDLRRLDLGCAAGNTASRAVAIAAGYTECGRQSATEPLGDGTFADLVAHERLR